MKSIEFTTDINIDLIEQIEDIEAALGVVLYNRSANTPNTVDGYIIESNGKLIVHLYEDKDIILLSNNNKQGIAPLRDSTTKVDTSSMKTPIPNHIKLAVNDAQKSD